MSDSLARQTSRGSIVTIAGQWSRTLLQLLSTVVLARLLAPDDFGLVAMVTAIVGVAELLREFGLGSAIVQASKIDERQWSSLYWLSALLGILFMGLAAASAPLVAAVYQDERLVLLTVALAPTVLINSLCMPLQARLQRELRFRSLATIEVVAMAVGVAASIAAALLGAGVWSLIVLNAVTFTWRLISLSWAVRPHFGAPRIERSVRPLMTIGGSVLGVQLLNYAARNLDNVVIGRALGAGVLGMYSRAYALLMLPINQLNGPLARVALPVLSRLRDEPERYRRYIRAALLVLAYASLPTFAIAAALSEPLVGLLLGEQWAEAAPIFSLLAIAGVAQALGNVSGWIYISLGRAHVQLVYFLITKPLVVASFVVGVLLGGVHGLALLYGLVSLALLVPGFLVAIRGTAVTPADVAAPVVRPLLLTPLCFGAAYLGSVAITAPDIVELLVGGVCGLAPLALSLVLPAYRRDLRQLTDFIARARSRGDASPPPEGAPGAPRETNVPDPERSTA
ncbi:lipopolysaccharide biosynthesis protein [Salinibacterium sp. SYSU T00001]|uniref:lipopolysaccharide biosynthesis protein n=1 Tax=Homoserinimonas sedimenticola TaxID=2986805 RepID=UPI0022355A46|nr:lipopolysaccharide biosynthesis protein [Salinibacterium sedimenticola]MCW4384766.1 lipopolysaccharide biosynthesis protein [Salinibacterium sedimenticola]